MLMAFLEETSISQYLTVKSTRSLETHGHHELHTERRTVKSIDLTHDEELI